MYFIKKLSYINESFFIIENFKKYIIINKIYLAQEYVDVFFPE